MDSSGNNPAPNSGSPRSSNTGSMRGTIGTKIPQQLQRASPQTVNNGGQPTSQRRPQHRRTHSEEPHGRTQEQQYYQQMGPPQGYNMHPSPQMMMQMPSPRVQGAPPVGQPRRAPPAGSKRRSHSRSMSWNPPPEMINAAYGISQSGNPLIPVLQEQDGESGGYSGRRRRSYSNASAGRDTPPPPPSGTTPQQQQSSRNAGNWSPRSELMGLTKSLSNRRTPPASPNRAAGAATGYRSMSPKPSPHSSLRSGYHPHQAGGARGESVQVKFSAGTTLDHPFSARSSIRNLQPWQHNFEGIPTETDSLLGKQVNGPGGGEAVFDAQSRSKKANPKMYMVQDSAHLFAEDIKGTPQRPACRDVIFVLLFLFHFSGMIFLGSTYGYEVTTPHNDDFTSRAITLNYWNVISVTCLCGAFAIFFSACTLLMMMTVTKRIVHVALILTISFAFAWGTIGIGVSPKRFVPITGIIALALSVAYTIGVWDRIPFATANLQSGLSAVRANLGAVLIAFAFQGITLAWTLYYAFILIGVYDALEVGDLTLSRNMTIFVYSMLGISYFWTFQVLMNIIQVTVAGTVGSWWFEPAESESPLWNESVGHAFFSAMFYSSGSICFGSLLIGPVHLLRQFSAFFRPSQDESILMCLHECVNCIQQCIANCVDSLFDHFNPWALTYVGLYGYGLLEAGHDASELFEKRGWTRIVSDDLVTNVLLVFSIVVGAVTGCVGLLIQRLEQLSFSNFDEPAITAFSIGAVVGLVLTSVLYSIVSSSVNAVIVCFAGSPLEFESNHPELSTEMSSAWREVWPGSMDVVDMQVGITTGGPQPIL